jgi:carboxypeptidase family protein
MRKRLALLLGLLCCLTHGIYAQSSNASLTGLVTDSSKAVIVGAKVTAVNEGTNIRYEGATNSAGSYYVTGLPPGTYRVEVEKLGSRRFSSPALFCMCRTPLNSISKWRLAPHRKLSP